MSKVARLPTDEQPGHQVDKQEKKNRQLKKSVTDLLRDVTTPESEREFLKKRLEDDIRTVLAQFAKELSQARKLRAK